MLRLCFWTLIFAFSLNLPATVQTAVVDQLEWKYEVASSGEETTILACGDLSVHGGRMVLPEELGGKPVTSVAEGAFANRRDLVSLVMSRNIRHFEKDAFIGCVNFTAVHVDTLEQWYAYAENDLDVWDGVYPGQRSPLFYSGDLYVGGDLLTNLVVDADHPIVPAHSFEGCFSLEKLTIQEGAKAIDYAAFFDCGCLTTIVIEALDCGMAYCFNDAAEHVRFEVPSLDFWFANSYGADNPLLACENFHLYVNGQLFTTYRFPSGTMVIPDYCLAGCRDLASVVIPDSVTVIGGSAFEECASLSSVELPPRLASIGPWAFAKTAIRNLSIPPSVEWIGESAFSWCAQLVSANLAETFRIVPESCFAGCGNLKNLVFSESITTIGENAFSSCDSLEAVALPNGVKEIGTMAFSYCRSLASVIFPSTLKKIGDYAFYRCALNTLVFPDLLREIGDRAFSECSGLKDVSLSLALESLGYRAFSGCSNLRQIEFFEAISSIGADAFEGCPLTGIVFHSAPPADNDESDAPTSLFVHSPELTVPEELADQWRSFVLKEGGAVSTWRYLPTVTPGISGLSGAQRFPWNDFVDVSFCMDSAIGNGGDCRFQILNGAWQPLAAFSCSTGQVRLAIDMGRSPVDGRLIIVPLGQTNVLATATFDFRHVADIAFTDNQQSIPIRLDPVWGNGETASLTIDGVKVTEVQQASEFAWHAAGGFHDLAFSCGNSNLTTRILIWDHDAVNCHGTTVISTNSVWSAEKVHVVGGFLTVASGCELKIQSGAIVKFARGAGIRVEEGGICHLQDAILTHINDDSFGGDTLANGAAILPGNGEYELIGNVSVQGTSRVLYYDRILSYGEFEGQGSVTLKGFGSYTINGYCAIDGDLTIEPGAIVKFRRSGYDIDCQGRIIAKGTRTRPIVITSAESDPMPGDWGSLLARSPGSEFEYCDFSYGADVNESGMLVYSGPWSYWDEEVEADAYLSVRNCSFRHGLYDGIWSWGDCRVQISNTIFTDLGNPVAPYVGEWSLENCTIAGCDHGLFFWDGWSFTGSSIIFRNTIFAEINGAWRDSGPASMDGVDVHFDHCLFYNPEGYANQSAEVVGTDGNIWGNPYFLDSEGGDFRIEANSSARGRANPETATKMDIEGVARDAAPDIGAYEYDMFTQPSCDLSPIELKVATESVLVSGRLNLEYRVVNNGERSASEHRDVFYLVHANGSTVELGSSMVSSVLPGATNACTASLTVPVIPLGSYSVRVVVNGRRDTYEGDKYGNNALTTQMKIQVDADYAMSSDLQRRLTAGEVTLLRLRAEDCSGLVAVKVPSGTVVSHCNGVVPNGSSRGMTKISDGSILYFSPGEGDVFLKIESDSGGDMVVGAIADRTAISSVTPFELAPNVDAHVTIHGAGFDETTTVEGASQVVFVDPSTLNVLFNGEDLEAGRVYDLVARSAVGEAVLSQGIKVREMPGKGAFFARLVVPSAVRQGRVYTCYVEYGNSGTIEIPAQIVQVEVDGDGGIDYVGGLGSFSALTFVAVGDSPCYGTLSPGCVKRIQFLFRAGADSSIGLASSWGRHDVEVGDLAVAAEKLGLRNEDPSDYIACKELSCRILNDDICNSVSGSVFAGPDGDSVNGVTVMLQDVVTSNTYSAVVTDGRYIIANIEPGTYAVSVDFGGLSSAKEVVTISDRTTDVHHDLNLDLTCRFSVSMENRGLPEGNFSAILESLDGGSFHLGRIMIGAFRFYGLSAGSYHLNVFKEGTPCWHTFVEVDNEDVDTPTIIANPGESSETLNISVEGRTDLSDCLVFLTAVSSDLIEVRAFAEACTVTFENVLRGEYVVSVVDTDRDVCLLSQTVLLSGDEHDVVLSVPGSATHSVQRASLSSMAIEDSGRVGSLVSLAKQIHDVLAPQVIAMEIPKVPKELSCKHNNDAYKAAVQAQKELKSERSSFKFVYTKFVNAYGLYTAKKLKTLFDGAVQIIAIKLKVGSALAEMLLNAYISERLTPSNLATALSGSGYELVDGVWFKQSSPLGTSSAIIGTVKSIGATLSVQVDCERKFQAARKAADEFLASIRKCEKLINKVADFCYGCKQPQYNWESDSKYKPENPRSIDPNEIVGPPGDGSRRGIKVDDDLVYTVYFENKSTAAAAAQEIFIDNPLSEYLDWSTFEVMEIAIGDQIDTGLAGKHGGVSEVVLSSEPMYNLRTELKLDRDTGIASWYLRIVDPHSETGWPEDAYAGILPPNDVETHCGEGHITYRIRLREDAPRGVQVDNSATIVFDTNEPISTDPSWWNVVVGDIAQLDVGDYFKISLSDLGIEVPPAGTVYSVKAYGLPSGLKLKANAAVKNKKGKIVTPAKINWWIEGVPASAKDYDANPAYVAVTVAGRTTWYPLHLETIARETVDLGELDLGVSISKTDWLEDVGSGWTVSGLPAGLKYATSNVYSDKAKKKLLAPARTVYGKTAKAGAYTIVAKKKVGSYYIVRKFSVFVKPSYNYDAVFADLEDLDSTAYETINNWNLVQTIGKCTAVSGLPPGIKFNAKTQVISGRPTKPGRYIATFTKAIGKKKKTAQIVWTVYESPDEPEISFNSEGGRIITATVGCAYADLLEFSASEGTVLKASGLPKGLSLRKLDTGSYALVGVVSSATTSFVTISATRNGKTITHRLAIQFQALPDWAKGVFNGCRSDLSSVWNLSVTSAGKISGTYRESGTNWTLSASSYSGFQGGFDEVDSVSAFFCDELVAKYTYSVKVGKKVVKKVLSRTFWLSVAPSDLGGVVEAGEGMDSLLWAQQNRWSTDFKSLGKKLFYTSSKMPYRTFSYTAENAPSLLSGRERLTLKIAPSGAVTATLIHPTGKFVKGKELLYKPVCSSVVIPATPASQGVAEFLGRIPLYFPASSADAFPLRCMIFDFE